MTLPSTVSKHITGLRHVGVVTEDLQGFIARMKEVFGVQDTEIVVVPAPDTHFAFFSIGGTPLEVIQPVSEHFRKVLFATNRGTNHLAFNVDDLDAAVAAMSAAGVRLGHVTPNGIVDMPHARMAYFNPGDTGGILIELVQPRSKGS